MTKEWFIVIYFRFRNKYFIENYHKIISFHFLLRRRIKVCSFNKNIMIQLIIFIRFYNVIN